MAPIYERRPNCPAKAHDTSGAYVHHGCRCEAAKAIRRQHREAYEERNPRRDKRIYKRVDQTPNEEIVSKLVSGLLWVEGARRYDRWEAVRRLALRGLTTTQIGARLGVDVRAVQRRLRRLTTEEWRVRNLALEFHGRRGRRRLL